MATKRPDLAAADYTVTGYLHEFLAPTLKRLQKGGTLYYTPLASGVTAQTTRQALGEVTANTKASAHTTYACGEILSRQRMSYDEVEQGYADLLHAELEMAFDGKNAVERVLEAAIATGVLGSATDLTAASDVVAPIATAAAELMDKAPGRPVALVMSRKVFNKLKQDSVVVSRMKNTGIAIGEGGDPRAVTAAQMAAIFGVDQVLVGRSDIWGGSTGALVALPDPAKAQNQEAQFARTLVYQTEDTVGIPFTCESYEDNDAKGYVVDTLAYADVKVLNSGLKKAFQFFAADASSASTSASASISG